MKNLTTLSKVVACLALAFVLVYALGHTQLTQSWTRDAALHVTATTSVATTDLRGTVTSGWDEVVIHNKDGAIWVGVHVIYARLSEAFGVDTFAEMQLFVPPVGSLTIRDENVIAVAAISESSSADLIFERGERR